MSRSFFGTSLASFVSIRFILLERSGSGGFVEWGFCKRLRFYSRRNFRCTLTRILAKQTQRQLVRYTKIAQPYSMWEMDTIDFCLFSVLYADNQHILWTPHRVTNVFKRRCWNSFRLTQKCFLRAACEEMRGCGGIEAEGRIEKIVCWGSVWLLWGLYVSDLCRQTFSDSWDHERLTNTFLGI